MSISRLDVQPVFATAIASHQPSSMRELSFDEGDLIEIRKNLGDGMVFAANVSKGSEIGVVLLKKLALNTQNAIFERVQVLVEEILELKDEYEALRLQREKVQREVAMMREAREELLKEVNPVRFAIRQVTELLLHLTQTDIELVEVDELVKEMSNEWNGIVADIGRLQQTINDPELDPFRRLVLERCDALKKRVTELQTASQDTSNACKLLHSDLENLTAALTGMPISTKISARSANSSAHSPTPSYSPTGAMPTTKIIKDGTTSSTWQPSTSGRPQSGNASPNPTTAGSWSSPSVHTGSTSDSMLSAFYAISPTGTSTSSSPNPAAEPLFRSNSPTPLSSTSSSQYAYTNQPTTYSSSSSHGRAPSDGTSGPRNGGSAPRSGSSPYSGDSNTRSTPEYVSPAGSSKGDRAGFLGGQRMRGSSPALSPETSNSDVPPSSASSPSIARPTTSTGSNFVFATKPGSLKDPQTRS